jgi:putative hemolysin
LETSLVDEPPSQVLLVIGDLLLGQMQPGAGFYLAIIILVLIVMLASSAIVSGSEVAYFAINLKEIDDLRRTGDQADARVVGLLSEPKYLLATILILNNFINVAIVTLSTYAAWNIFQNAKEAALITALTAIITFLIVFFGEIVPKIYATQERLKFARRTSGLLLVTSKIVRPLAWLLVNLTSIVERKINRGSYDSSSIEEVHHALEMTTHSGITEEEKDILKGIVNFSSISVTQIMKSRLDIIAVENNISFHELLDLINKEGYSRIPVFTEDIDKIDGILYVKDLLPYIEEEENFEWQKLTRQAYFVPETKMIDDLLRDFQEMRVHIAIVVDEYGGTSGLVTMEDIIEEIVGEISDEFDDDDEIYRKVAENIYEFEGRTSVYDMCKALKLEPTTFDSIKGESESIGGMLLEEFGQIPNTNDFIEFENFTFTISAVDKRRIKRVRIKID